MMKPFWFSKTLGAALIALVAICPVAKAHFLWLAIEPGEGSNPTKLRAFFNENPDPDSEFTKYVRDVRLFVGGHAVSSQVGTESRDGLWVGRRPDLLDSELDLGVTARGPKTFRLLYTARAQAEPQATTAKERGDKLRARVLTGDVKDRVEVLFDGKPVPAARIRVYPEQGKPSELKTDDKGLVTVPGISEGKTAIWANWIDPTPGEIEGKKFTETRYYSTLTFTPSKGTSAEATTTFATMPDPPVTSLGAAVQGNSLYVYGGHTGRTHKYSVDTTSKHFRRLNLEDGKTWEELPMGKDLQGLTLVSDGKFLYRTGGMSARNKPGEEEDMFSVAEFERFDPETKKWTSLPPLPEPRSTHDTAVLGRKIYVVGGWNMKGASEESEFLDHALAFDLDHPEAGWKSIPQPFQRRALAAAAYQGKLYVLGGLVGGGMKVERRVDIYDPEHSSWSRGPDLPNGERAEGFASSAFELDGRLYVSGASGKLLRLNTAGDAWEAIGGLSLPRIAYRLVPTPKHSLLAVGGSSKGKTTALIEVLRVPPEFDSIRSASASGR